RGDGGAVLQTRGERLDLHRSMRLPPPRSLAPEVLQLVPQKHREQLEGIVARPRHRARLGQSQERDEALLDRVESILGVKATPASVGEQPLPVCVDELRDPGEEARRRVEAAVGCLVFVERWFGQSYGHHVPLGHVGGERYTLAHPRWTLTCAAASDPGSRA